METDPPRVSSTGMCGELRLSTTVINRLDLAKADSHTGGMMLSFSHRSRSRTACLAVVITALLCAAYPPKAVGTAQEDRWQWPTGEPVPVVEGSLRRLTIGCPGGGESRWAIQLHPWSTPVHRGRLPSLVQSQAVGSFRFITAYVAAMSGRRTYLSLPPSLSAITSRRGTLSASSRQTRRRYTGARKQGDAPTSTQSA